MTGLEVPDMAQRLNPSAKDNGSILVVIMWRITLQSLK